MKKILILFLMSLFVNSAVYAYCKKPDCSCFTDRCKEERAELRKKLNWMPDNGGVFVEEKKTVLRELVCFYKIPFTQTKTYFFKTVTFDSKCRELFQIGYIDTLKLRAVVMKDDFESDMEIFHRPVFESIGNLNEYVEKQWGEARIIHHKSLKYLQ